MKTEHTIDVEAWLENAQHGALACSGKSEMYAKFLEWVWKAHQKGEKTLIYYTDTELGEQ